MPESAIPEPLKPTEESRSAPASVSASMPSTPKGTVTRHWLDGLFALVLVLSLTGMSLWLYQKFGAGLGQIASNDNLTGPAIHLDETVLDLGDVALDDGEVMPVSFRFENRGQSPLTIREISSSCTCTNAKATRKVTPPGEAGEINVQVRRSQLGRGSAMLIVYTDDHLNPRLELKCQWNGIARLQFDQSVIDFGELLPGATAERELKLTFRDQQRFPTCQVVKFILPPEITLTPQAGAVSHAPLAEETRYQIVLRASRQLGQGRGIIRCQLQGCFKQELTIPVSWMVRTRVQATPQELFLDAGRAGAILKKKVIITSSAPDHLVIQSARLIPEGIGSATLKRISDMCQEVEVSMTLTSAEQPLQGVLVLECLEPVKELLEVRWTAVKLP